MRLIDEHKATDDICEHITTRAVSRVIAILQGQPTIEAIPISWMEKWVRNDRTADPDTFIDLISDWRKENETHRQGQTESAGI